MINIYFTYPDAVTFSGQTEASRQILKLLKKKDNFVFHINTFPAFAHKSREDNAFKFILRLIRFYIINIKIVFKKPDIIYLNLGQSYLKFLLHAIPILLVKFICQTKLVISLHGNTFINWPNKTILLRLFKYILKKANLITYLGANQKESLLKLNIQNLKQVNNCIDSSIIKKEFLVVKQNFEKIKILHLSLLIESKGFPIFLDAFNVKSIEKHKKNIEVILCGPIHFTPDDERFKTVLSKEKWINEKIEKLRDCDIDIRWIKGATGKFKNEIFKNTTIFVFPSTFPVEAQPLVLLEAAANGCAIITTETGEIKNMFTKKEVLFLKDATDISVANGIKFLIENPLIRLSLAHNAYKKLETDYSIKNYEKTWKNIFTNLDEI
jgi:glycosyltransferase involved in cell wall biosynthesis